MSWNHRILAHVTKEETLFEIHEVYNDEKGVPNGYTKNAVSVSAENLTDINWTLEKMKDCTKKPILWAGDKFPKEYKPK